ncbi:MAG: nitrilase-related carbon-nitrogen hydrolase [Opitutales bacterium]
MLLSLAQYRVARGDVATNLKSIDTFAAEAAKAGSALLCLPEMATTGFDWARNRELCKDARRHLEQVGQISRSRGIALCGSFLERTESGGMANTLFYFSREGKVVGQYRKIHLFTLFHEERHVEAGDAVCVADTDEGKVGFAVCYDLRFPELFRKNTEMGACLQLLPSAFPHPRLAHWQTLVRARAIENQCLFVAVNQCGPEGHAGNVGRVHYFGHSMVVDPWGDILFEAGEAEGLFSVEVDLNEVERIRSKLTAWQDRRPELY